MIEPNSSWICQRKSAWQPQSFKYLTANVAMWQAEPMPAHVDPHYVSAYAGPNGYNICGLRAEKGVKIEGEGQFEQHSLFRNIRTSLPTTNMNSYSNEHQLNFPSVHDWKEAPYEATYSQPKKFLIFDHSGEETRMILSTLCSPICNGEAITTEPVMTYKSLEKLHAFKSEQSCPKVPDLSEDSGEDSGENHVTGVGSDYHEDIEEINALLYSCDDDIDDIHDHEDGDEVSTGRSPNFINDGYKNTEEEGGDFDEVSSFWRSSKRQKLIEGDSYSKLSCMETNEAMTKSATQLYGNESVENLNSSDGEQASPSLSWKRTRMHKIHGTLRILQKLIPDSKTKEPLVIIDEAISYLNSLKDKSLHMDKADGSSWSIPSL